MRAFEILSTTFPATRMMRVKRIALEVVIFGFDQRKATVINVAEATPPFMKKLMTMLECGRKKSEQSLESLEWASLNIYTLFGRKNRLGGKMEPCNSLMSANTSERISPLGPF